MDRLRVTTLGRFEARLGDGSPLSWPSRKALRLFQILLTYRGSWVQVERLVEWIWPRSPPKAGRNRLHVHLSHLRRALQPSLPSREPGRYIETGDSAYRLRSASELLSVDVDDYLAHAMAARRLSQEGQTREALAAGRAALEVYRGPYLPDAPYEDWALAQRRWLQENWLGLLELLCGICRSRRDFDEARRLATLALGADPVREWAWRERILAQVEGGDRGGALQAFEEYKATLRRELGLEPSPALVEVARAIERGGALSVPSAGAEDLLLPVTLPFVGREKALGRLLGAWQKAQGGRGGVVWIRGEAGIGKTRLVREFLAAARVASHLETHCQRLTASQPYQAVHEILLRAVQQGGKASMVDLLGPWEGVLSGWFPSLAGSARGAVPEPTLSRALAEARLHQALVETLARLGKDRPWLIWIEDAHWADADSLAVLERLISRLDGSHVLLVLTLRSEGLAAEHALRAVWAESRRQTGHLDLTLLPLSRDELRDLLARLFEPREAEWSLDRLMAETRGHPLFLLETLRGLYEHGRLEVAADGRVRLTESDSAAGLGQMELPASLREAIRDRLRELSQEARRVLAYLAVLGEPGPYHLLQALGGWSSPALFATLEDLTLRRLVTGTDEGYMVAHSRIAQVVYEDLDLAARVAMHRQVARALETAEAPRSPRPSVVARHWQAAGEGAKAACYWLEAGDLAARAYANAEAVRAYRMAAQALHAAGLNDWAARAWLRVGKVHAEVTHRYSEAESAYRAALDSLPEELGNDAPPAPAACPVGAGLDTTAAGRCARSAGALATLPPRG